MELIIVIIIVGLVYAGYLLRGILDRRGNTEAALKKRAEYFTDKAAKYSICAKYASTYDGANVAYSRKRDLALYKAEVAILRLKAIRNGVKGNPINVTPISD